MGPSNTPHLGRCSTSPPNNQPAVMCCRHHLGSAGSARFARINPAKSRAKPAINNIPIIFIAGSYGVGRLHQQSSAAPHAPLCAFHHKPGRKSPESATNHDLFSPGIRTNNPITLLPSDLRFLGTYWPTTTPLIRGYLTSKLSGVWRHPATPIRFSPAHS